MQRVAVRGGVKALVALTYVVMIAMNVAANALPINGRTTAAVSDSYPNLFAPAGITFAIWGVIYLLLGAHVLYQLGCSLRPAMVRTPPASPSWSGWGCCSRSRRW